MSLKIRYDEAYAVARSVNTAGLAIKIVGIGGAAVIVAISLTYVQGETAQFGYLGILFGVISALVSYGIGVLVSAQSQVLRATIDTAVNTASLLSHADEVRRLLGASAGAAQTEPSQRLPSLLGGEIPWD